jgi:hypothetical protein
MRILLLIGLLSTPGTHYFGADPEYTNVPRYFAFGTTVGASVLGPSAPSFATCGSVAGLSFGASDTAQFGAGIYPCWDGVNDVVLVVGFTNTEGDVIADGETVVFDYEYRTLSPGDSASAGTAKVITMTYTQSGAGTACESIILTQTIDRNDGTWPYTYGDSIQGFINWDASSTYSGEPVVGIVFFNIPNNKECQL